MMITEEGQTINLCDNCRTEIEEGNICSACNYVKEEQQEIEHEKELIEKKEMNKCQF